MAENKIKNDKLTKKMYRIPVDQREIHISMKESANTKFHVLDNVGFVLFYDKEINDEYIRQHLSMMKRTFEIIIAESKNEAIAILSKELEGLSVGGQNSQSKAQQIITEKIEEIPLCPRIKLETEGKYKGDFMCHMLNSDGSQDQEYLQGCMFSGYDAPSCCPIKFIDDKWQLCEPIPDKFAKLSESCKRLNWDV